MGCGSAGGRDSVRIGVGALVSIMRGRTAAFLGARVIHDIRSQVYEQLQRLSVAYYDKRKSVL
jgi:ABC-type multidrug transport system fused ATPase/permease subunit